MSLFDGPEHASYVRLMRELRLEHHFEFADWYRFEMADPAPEFDGDTAIWVWGPEAEGFGPGRPAGTIRLWLPRLDQWLVMLEGAGVTSVTMDEAGAEARHDGQTFSRYAPSHEEAAARLWMAVTRR